MSVSSALSFGPSEYPVKGLGSYGGAEEKKSRRMRFTSEQGGPPQEAEDAVGEGRAGPPNECVKDVHTERV